MQNIPNTNTNKEPIECISISSEASNLSDQENSLSIQQGFLEKNPHKAKDSVEKEMIENKENAENFHFVVPNIQIERKPKVRLTSELTEEDKQFLIKRMLPQHLKGTNTSNTILILPEEENRARLLKVNPKRLEYEKINKNLSSNDEISKEMMKYVPEHYHALFEGLTNDEKGLIYKDLVKEMNFIDSREVKYNEIQKHKLIVDQSVSLAENGDHRSSDEGFFEFQNDELDHQNTNVCEKNKVEVVFFSQFTEYKCSESESQDHNEQEKNRLESFRLYENMEEKLGEPQKKSHIDFENRNRNVKQRTRPVLVRESMFQLKEYK